MQGLPGWTVPDGWLDINNTSIHPAVKVVIVSILGIGSVVGGAYGMILSGVCDWQMDQPDVDNPDYQEIQDRIAAITCGAASILAPGT